LGEAAPYRVVIEASGGLETQLAASLLAAGVSVAVVNPRQVRDYAKATGQLAKTDRIDALVLADFARAIRPAVRPMKDACTRELDELVTRRRQLVEMRVQESLRLGRATKVQQKSLKSHIAWLDKRVEGLDSEEALTSQSRLAGEGRPPAQHSRGGRHHLRDAPRQTPRIGYAGPQRHRRTRRCRRPGQRQRQTAGQARHLGRACRDPLRAVHVDRHGHPMQPVIHAFAERLKAAGKPAKVVIVACMRKLLSIMNAMVKSNSPWNPKIA